MTLYAFTETEKEYNNRVRETEKERKTPCLTVFTLVVDFLSSESPRTGRVG